MKNLVTFSPQRTQINIFRLIHKPLKITTLHFNENFYFRLYLSLTGNTIFVVRWYPNFSKISNKVWKILKPEVVFKNRKFFLKSRFWAPEHVFAERSPFFNRKDPLFGNFLVSLCWTPQPDPIFQNFRSVSSLAFTHFQKSSGHLNS